ncbi:MAG: PSD1 and planctomycete cytochrome C domain-containing protein [Acidobacteriia bacterium]|nr:PSD1 and planctomycete cytochrome C domain-containing protein [Terriglobia bacterium]
MLKSCILLAAAVIVPASAQQPGTAPRLSPGVELFEKKIRPVLAAKCYTCHASNLSAPMGGLVLDTNAGLRKGGADGPVVVAGKPAESLLLQALRYTDRKLQMPPSGKLPDSVIADFEQWIAAGAPDPRQDVAAAGSPAPLKGMSLEEGRKWWAFQPVHEIPAPPAKDAAWPRTKIDSFVLSKLDEKGLKPSPEADPRTLVTRAFIDLLGFRPSYEEVQTFVNDRSPDAWPKLIDRLLASSHYGEQWARHWMDVARFGEDNPTSEATNPPYPLAWRYRDWIIEALNKDVPYDRFVRLQLAADQMPGASRSDLRALGYLGAAPVYHKDQRLSAEVIGGFMTDDWDERVDAVSRGLLAMTVACARCHDHKFDPIPTKDYYGLVGVFASTMRAERPLFDVDPKTEQRYLWIQNRLFDLHYSVDLLTNEASTVEGAAPRVEKWKAEIARLKSEMDGMAQRYPALAQSLEKYYPKAAPDAPAAPPANAAAAPPSAAAHRNPATQPFANAVYDAAQYVNASDEHFTWIEYRPGEARDFPVLLHGNVGTPGELVPRHFLSVLSQGDSTFQHGSGRLDLGERIFTDGAALASRVIVNRVWGWHFGKALVPTSSDFGVQGEKPANPGLLDDLAARFIAHGWSLKWLNREIMLSAAYRQSSHASAEASKIDPVNTYLWRMNPRRMDIEAWRDSILRAAGTLNEEMYGPSQEVDARGNTRRTVYARVSRGRLSDLLRIYDFPDPTQTSSDRDLTTTSLQQLFVMNSAFMHTQAAALADAVRTASDNSEKIRILYRKILSRDPTEPELDRGVRYLSNGTTAQYAQILLSVNEEIFWP